MNCLTLVDALRNDYTSLIPIGVNTALLVYQLKPTSVCASDDGGCAILGTGQGCGTTNDANRAKGLWQSCPVARAFAMRITIKTDEFMPTA